MDLKKIKLTMNIHCTIEFQNHLNILIIKF